MYIEQLVLHTHTPQPLYMYYTMATRRCSSRYCQSFSRGTLLVLAWRLLIVIGRYYGSMMFPLLLLPYHLEKGLYYASICLWVLLPVAGWLGDSLLGRYRAIIAGFMLSALGLLALLSSFLMLQLNRNPVPAFIVLCVSQLMDTLGLGILYTNLLPFIIDQMIGASAKDIGAAVQWYFWVASAGMLSQRVFVCLSSIAQQYYNIPAVSVTVLTVTVLALSAVLITDCLCHKWLEIHYKSSKPFKIIFKVLNYARKTKYPEHRSALTYIDEEEPSRLDYGKHKFGGPFTEEEVEDVKTVLRLIPLYLSIFGVFIAHNLQSKNFFQAHLIHATAATVDCINSLQHVIYYILAILLIPIYQLVLLPLLHNRIPSLIKLITAGLFLCFIVSLMDLTMDTIGHSYRNITQCMFTADPESALPIPFYWVLVSDVLNGIGALLIVCSIAEFLMAQTPNRMRGVMTGLGVTLVGAGSLLHQGLESLLRHFHKATPSCGFYYYLVLSILLLMSLVLFTITAKRYKLRERDRHVNIQAIAEEHYERYLDQEEEYIREVAARYKTNTITVQDSRMDQPKTAATVQDSLTGQS